MKLIFIFFAFLIAYSFSLNLFRYLRCKSLFQEHKLYFSSLTSGRAYEGNITYKQNEIIELFENANIPRPSFGQISPLGFGFVAKNVVDEFDNMFNLDERIVSNIIHCYEIAIGEYHHRMINSINPLEWIRTIIFLPKTIIKYIGYNSDTKIVNIIQIIYWMLQIFILLNSYFNWFNFVK